LLGSFSSSGNTNGGDVSSPEPSIDAFSDGFVGAIVVVSSLTSVSFDDAAANAGVISISSDNGISAAVDKSTVSRMANVFYQLVGVITFDKHRKPIVLIPVWRNMCDRKRYLEKCWSFDGKLVGSSLKIELTTSEAHSVLLVPH
jgi:hypothetical protein